MLQKITLTGRVISSVADGMILGGVKFILNKPNTIEVYENIYEILKQGVTDGWFEFLDPDGLPKAEIIDVSARGSVSNINSQLSVIAKQLLESTGYGIVNGLKVAQQTTPNMTVQVPSGVIRKSDGTEISSAGSSSIAITAADANNSRRDIIYVDSTGAIKYLAGTTLSVKGKNTYSVTTNFVAGDVITFDKNTITASSSIQDGTHFIVGVDIATSATNLATALNANAVIGLVYRSTASTGVITITEIASGTGNTPDSMTISGTGVVTIGTAMVSTPAVIPSTPSESTLLSVINVHYGYTSITGASIMDKRNMLLINQSTYNRLRDVITFDVKEDFGAVGDGVTDDSQAFLNAIAACLLCNSAVLLVPDGHYVITQQLTFYCDIMTIEGYGAKLDFSHMASGSTAIKIITSTNPTATDSASEYSNNIRKDQIHYAKGLYIFGNKSITALNFDAGSGNYISEGFNFEHCVITNFNVPIRIYSNCWCVTFHYCNISNNNLAVNMPTGGTNYAERITFIGCNLHSNLQTFVMDNPNGQFHLIGCSLDYNYQYAYVKNGRMYFTNCHIESTKDTDYYFYAFGSNAFIFLKNCEYYFGKVTYPVGHVENGGTIDMNGGFITYTTYSVGKLIDGYGNVSFKGIGDTFGNAGPIYKELNFPPIISANNTSYSVTDSSDIIIPYKLVTCNNDLCFVTYTIDGVAYSTSISQRGYNYFRVGYLASGSHTVTIQAVNSSGNKSNVFTVSITVTATTSGTVIISDTFNRSDNTYLGIPATGEVWNAILGTASIVSQKAKFTALGANNNCLTLINSITPNFTMSCDVTYGTNGTIALIYRSDHIGSSFYTLTMTTGKVAVRQNISGVGGIITTQTVTGATDYAFTPVAGTTYTLKVACSGSTVTCYLNGTSIITFTDSSLSSQHYAGLYSYNDIATIFDNFSITAL